MNAATLPSVVCRPTLNLCCTMTAGCGDEPDCGLRVYPATIDGPNAARARVSAAVAPSSLARAIATSGDCCTASSCACASVRPAKDSGVAISSAAGNGVGTGGSAGCAAALNSAGTKKIAPSAHAAAATVTRRNLVTRLPLADVTPLPLAE